MPNITTNQAITYTKTCHLDYSCCYLRVVISYTLLIYDVTMELLKLSLLIFLEAVVVSLVIFLLPTLPELFSATRENEHHY